MQRISHIALFTPFHFLSTIILLKKITRQSLVFLDDVFHPLSKTSVLISDNMLLYCLFCTQSGFRVESQGLRLFSLVQLCTWDTLLCFSAFVMCLCITLPLAAHPCPAGKTRKFGGLVMSQLPPVCSLNDAWHIRNSFCVSSHHRMDIVEHYKTIQDSSVL